MIQHLAEFFRDGGPFMFVNLVASAVAVAIIVERTIALAVRLNVNAKPFMDQIQKLVLTGNVERALMQCGAAPHAALSQVVRAGLARAGRGEAEVAKALEEAMLEVAPLVSRRIGALWSLANVATLLGLIGTITGLIGTFRSLGAATPEMKQLMLSRGIAEAMNNTAFGLAVAVTCIVAHLLLHAKSRAILDEVELHAVKLENLLARRAAAPPDEARTA